MRNKIRSKGGGKQPKYIGVERRFFIRAPLEHPILQCLNGTDDFKAALCLNISLNGLLLFASDHYSPKQILDVRLDYTSDKKTPELTLRSEVVWSDEGMSQTEKNKKQYLIAVNFLDPSTDQRMALKKFMEKYCKPTSE